jgi:hypothetical protein
MQMIMMMVLMMMYADDNDDGIDDDEHALIRLCDLCTYLFIISIYSSYLCIHHIYLSST